MKLWDLAAGRVALDFSCLAPIHKREKDRWARHESPSARAVKGDHVADIVWSEGLACSHHMVTPFTHFSLDSPTNLCA